MPKQRHPIKRVWLILTFPFELIYMIVSLPFKIAYIIIKDFKRPRKKIKRKNIKDVDFFGIGKLLYGDSESEFEAYYNSFLTDNKLFYKKFQHILNSNSNLSPIEVLHLFGEYKGRIILMDWRGEENEYELEEYIELGIGQKISWTNAHLLRASVAEELQRDGKFIVKLFEAIDKDLRAISKKLLFFEMLSDGYYLIPVETVTCDEILNNASGYFKGADDFY